MTRMRMVMMGSRQGRLILAVTMVVALMMPAVAFGAKSEVSQLKDKLASLRAEAKRAGDAYSDSYWELDKTKAELAQTDKELAETRQQLAEAQARLGERVNEMYRRGSSEYIALLLTSDDLDDILMRVEYMQRIGEHDADVIAEVESLQAQLEERRAAVLELKEQQSKEAADLKKRADALESKLKSTQAEYDKALADLEAALKREAAKSGVTYSPGSNGMVFPVRGTYYYTDTWGAARSGGRSHKGTDIMAPHGTPTVAVMAGTVRAKSNSLGGLTIWLTGTNGWAFYYAHLQSYAVRSGRVSAGQVIGYVGSTGNASASAPHLHFEIHPNGGAAVNPYPYLRAME